MSKSKSHGSYQPLDWADDDHDADGSSDGSGARYAARNALLDRREKRLLWLLCGSIGILFTSLCVLIAAWNRVPSEMDSAKRVSPFCKIALQTSNSHSRHIKRLTLGVYGFVAPIWDAVEFWEGDLINYFSHKSIYRGPPTLEREQAWFDLWHR